MIRRISILVSIFLSISLNVAGAQRKDVFETAASKIIKKISKSDNPRVLIAAAFVCLQPCFETGRGVADRLDAALREAGAVEVVGREQQLELLKVGGFLSIDRFSPTMPRLLAAAAGAGFVVTGQIEENESGMRARMRVTQPADNKLIQTFGFALPLGITHKPDHPVADPTGPFLIDVGGIAAPQCIECPFPAYPPHMTKNRPEGEVEFVATVGTAGEVTDIVPVKTLTQELNELALSAARTWKFRPAQDPQGNAVPSRVTLSIRFAVSDMPRFIASAPTCISCPGPQAKRSGVVLLNVRVTEAGAVDDAKVLEGKDPELAGLAIAAVKSWRFQPAMHKGKPVARWIRIEVSFRQVQ